MTADPDAGIFDVDAFDAEAFEASARESVSAMERLQGSVPRELEGPYATLLEANRELIDLLEEYDWDIFSIPEDEPTMMNMLSEEVVAAAEAMIEYCGISIPGPEPTDPGEMGDLEELMPPRAGEVLSTSPILMVESSASYEDLVDHYTDVLGRGPVNEGTEDGQRNATFLGERDGGPVVVFIEEAADGIVVAISGG